MQQDDERALPLVDVMHADTVYFGEAVIERAGVVGIHLPQVRRAADRHASQRSGPFSARPSKFVSLKDSPDGLRQLSFPGYNLVKLGQATAHACPDAKCQPYRL